MVRYFCDRCNDEYSSTGKVSVSTPTFSDTPLLCSSCITTLENMVVAFLKNNDNEADK